MNARSHLKDSIYAVEAPNLCATGRRPSRSYVYAPPRPLTAQRLAATYWLRWKLRQLARWKRRDAFSEFEFVRRSMRSLKQFSAEASGAISFAQLLDLITKAEAERYGARLNRIRAAAVKHPPRSAR